MSVIPCLTRKLLLLLLDSRLRGNDKDGAAERCRGLGCPQVSLILPHEWGTKGVDIKHGDTADRRREDTVEWAQPTLRLIAWPE